MKYDEQLKIQAYLDGELSENESREVANRLARDRDAVALLGELRNTRQALKGFEQGIKLPESGDFFWSKVARAIEAEQPVAPVPEPWLASWRRFLLPAGAAAAVAVTIFLGLLSGAGISRSEMAVADPGALTYRDFSSHTTLVWFSYPAENELADKGTADTVR